ncbi:MAG: hypothetical protein AB8H80_02080 [Planctomycetota bacterium]
MVGIIIKAVIGLALFVGSLVGGLAATGRLNHEGTANIPVLGGFFPEPPPEPEGEGEEGEGVDGEAADAAGGGHGDGLHGSPADGHADGSDATAEDAALDGQDPQKARRRKVGKSVVNPEEPKSDGHGGGHGGGHGEDPHAEGGAAGDGHGGGGHGGGHEAAGDGHGKSAHGGASGGHGKAGSHDPADGRNPAERDFDELAKLLQSQGRTSYEPGAFFSFQGMPAGLTPAQLNEAWQRVDGIMRTIKQREEAQALKEKELQELADDIGRRWKDLGKRQLELEQMQRELDNKIASFERTVRLVRDDETVKLKRNADTLAAFEREKAAELLQQQWQSERGQDEILRLLEFMETDAVNEILQLLPNAMVQDVLEKRMTVSKEAKAKGKRD